MQTCSVCLMVLDESGICRLCGSEEKVGIDSTNPQDTKGSVDLPFGLGQDSEQGQSGLPYGIIHAPSHSAELPPAKHIEHENSDLPFGLEHSPDNENLHPELVEVDLQKGSLPFGIEGSPSENKPNSNEKSTKSSINTIENLPFGIEHIFDSTDV